MDAKLNHSDLSALLAKGAGMSLAKAELFTKTIFDLVIEGLEQDGTVKINGLGTFKLTDVASRSSVNVNTGEKFEIKGHKKLVFTPADSLKDCVNQPFAMFEPVEVDETYNEDTEDESNEALDEENNSSEEIQADVEETCEAYEENAVAEATVSEIVEETAVEAEECAEKQDNKAVEEFVEEQTEEPVEHLAEPEEQPAVEQPKRPEPVMVHVPKKEKKPFAVPEKKSKKNRTALYVVSSVLFVFAAMAVLFILYIVPARTDSVRIDTVAKTEYKTDAATEATVIEGTVTKAEYNTDAVTGATVDATSGATSQDKELVSNESPIDVLVLEQTEPEEYKFVITNELALLDLKNITEADTTLYDMLDVWTEHKVVAGETLTRIALKYYGDKKLWPYIVKYNSMSRPDDLRKGMKILVPKLKPRN